MGVAETHNCLVGILVAGAVAVNLWIVAFTIKRVGNGIGVGA